MGGGEGEGEGRAGEGVEGRSKGEERGLGGGGKGGNCVHVRVRECDGEVVRGGQRERATYTERARQKEEV